MSRAYRYFMVLAAILIAAIAAGCGNAPPEEDVVAHEAIEISDQEGAVCGMLLREQTAPRAQVVHRDGERAFLCSISDLLVYLDAPSPHGRAVHVLVEAMDPDQDPEHAHTGAHPWLDAREAVYVVGIERRGVMGEPVLIYHDAQAAEEVIEGTSARVLGFDALRGWWSEEQQSANRHEPTS